jgi:hypothetical protein
MKNFEEFLQEGRDAPLYHGVSHWSKVHSILDDDLQLRPLTQHEPKELMHNVDGPIINGISLTRSKEFALHWSKITTLHSMNSGIVFQLNQRKLQQRYRLVPIQYWQGGISLNSARFMHAKPSSAKAATYQKTNEYEEFLISSKPVGLSPYLEKAFVSTEMIDTFRMIKSFRKLEAKFDVEVI